VNEKIVPTYEARIFCGLKEGYDGLVHTVEEVIEICQAYCNEVRLGAIVQTTWSIFSGSNAPQAQWVKLGQ